MRSVLFAFAVGLATASGAQEADGIVIFGETLGLVRAVELEVDDQVSGNCWTNSSGVRAKVRLILEQSDIRAFSEPFAVHQVTTPLVRISALGLRASNGTCAVRAEFGVYSDATGRYGGWEGNPEVSLFLFAQIFKMESVFVSGSNTNKQLTDFFEEAASEFAANVISLRRSDSIERFFIEYPNAGDPTTEAEWEEIFKNASDN